MTSRVLRPRMKGFIALDAHPVGCAYQVSGIVEQVRADAGQQLARPGPVVVLGGSGGYGLPAAAVAAFRYRLPVVVVCLERPAQRGRTATAGWYNVVQLARQAREQGVETVAVNADAFADATKDRVVHELQRLGPPSLLVYSVAAPVRTDPDTGVVHRSVLKPIGAPFATKTVKIDSGDISETTLEPASDDEIDATIRVMGGDDWARWIEALDAVSLIEDGFRTVAFDYIGPNTTYPIYRSGTIGQAKAHLEQTARSLDDRLAPAARAWTSVNAAAVTQSSSAIPAVPLYLSLLLRVAREAGTFETPGDQMRRLFDDYLAPADAPPLDEEQRIRLDTWELAEDLQAEVARRWEAVTNETFRELGDFEAFQREFRRLFGFDVANVDYATPVDPDIAWPH